MKFLIIDDHLIVREGVAAILRQIDVAVEILEAGDGKTGLTQLAAHTDFDCVLRGIEGSHHIHPQRPVHVTVPHPRKGLGLGLVRTILKQTGLDK